MRPQFGEQGHQAGVDFVARPGRGAAPDQEAGGTAGRVCQVGAAGGQEFGEAGAQPVPPILQRTLLAR